MSPDGKEIAAFRKSLGLTQVEAARITHTGRSTWKCWENNRRKCHPATWEGIKVLLARHSLAPHPPHAPQAPITGGQTKKS